MKFGKPRRKTVCRRLLGVLTATTLVLSGVVGVSMIAPSQANAAVLLCAGTVDGDWAHISKESKNNGERATQGHGWWKLTSGPCTRATVTVQIQMQKSFLFIKYWQNVGFNSTDADGKPVPPEALRPGGGSASRNTGHYKCANDRTIHSFRTVASARFVPPAGAGATTATVGSKTTNPQSLNCG
jgi:hypothetical protein